MIGYGEIVMYLRKILGTRGTKIIRNIAGNLFPPLGLVPKPGELGKDECVSAFVRVKDEEAWLEPSLLSIQDLVQEYIVIDSSQYDNSPKIIEYLKENGLNIMHIIDHDPDPVQAWNRGLKYVRCKWILRWDPDFIAKEELTPYLKSLIKKLDSEKYYNIYWPHICLDLDLYHQLPGIVLHKEHWLVTYSRGVRFIHMKGFYGFMYTPLYHIRVDIDKPLSFHLRTVKPPIRLLYRKYHKELAKKQLLGKVDLEEYVKKRIREEYGVSDIEEAANIYFKELMKHARIYDKSKYGDYPKILKEYAWRKYGIKL